MSARTIFRFKSIIKNQFLQVKNNSILFKNHALCSNVTYNIQCRSISFSQNLFDQRQGNDLSISYKSTLPSLQVPLPSRDEFCLFTIRPTGNTVGDLMVSIADEDHGIDHIVISNTDGVRMAKSTMLQNLISEDFNLQINDIKYSVKCENPDLPDMTSDLGDLQETVMRLHSALSCDKLANDRRFELKQRLEQLQHDIEPYEKLRREVELVADRKTIALQWFCLGMMGMQFGLLARLTWWEYSWDIMEPVTYFVTYGTAIALYAYFVVTKQEPNFSEMSERRFLLYLHQHAASNDLDIVVYNRLRRQISSVEDVLSKLQSPQLCDVKL